MILSPKELETNYVNHINLDEICLLEYDVTIHNFKPFLFALEWSIYTTLSRTLNHFTKYYRLKLGDFIITIPFILIILTLTLYFLFINNIKYTGILSQICLFITILTSLKKINILPFDKIIYYHKIFSILTLFISLFHGIVGIYIKRNKRINDKIITGYIFYILLLIINLFSVTKFKDKYYHIFVNVHKILFIFIFIISMIHGNGLTIIPLFIYLIDLFYRLYLVKKINKLKWNINYSILSKDIIKIEILDNKLYCHSAQYVYICIPQISLLEWHPYSIANAPNENKIIYIKVLGDWTKNLKYLIQNNEKIDIYFDGFYGNISKYLLEYQYILLIGGGLGITPILSILKHIYYNYKNNLQYIKKIHFICSFDDFQKITHLLDSIYSEYKEIFNKENIYKFNLFNTYIHITNNKNNISNNELDIFSFKYFISQERPNIHKYITDFNMMAFNDNIKKIGIFTSGPEAMVNDVFEYANLVSKTTNIKHDIYTENYKY